VSTPHEKYRLVTRSDFDGLVCAVLLKHLDLIDDIKFVHPKDMQDGLIEITDRDITTNLPFVPGAYLVFDHHASEILRTGAGYSNHIIDPEAPSAARVVYKHYGGAGAFPAEWDDMMAAVDKGDSAAFSRDEILHPRGWVLLNFLMDSRTGLGRFRNFRISNYQLMMDLIDSCRMLTVDRILEQRDVVERVDLYRQHELAFQNQLRDCSRVEGNLVILDLRDQEIIYPGNRFMIYALYPDCDISMHILWGMQNRNTVFAVGKSIIKRTSRVNIGELMLEYGGGGHEAAGTCQVDNQQAQTALEELILRINKIPSLEQSAIV